MVSWQAFPSLPPSSRAPRVSLAPKTPFHSLSKACHAGYMSSGHRVLHTLYSFEVTASPSHGQFPLAKTRCKLSPSCQVMFSTSHSRYSALWWIKCCKMTYVDCLDLHAQELGFVLKSEQREALELLLRGKEIFRVLSTGFDKSLIYQMFVHEKSSSSSVQRPTVIVISPV